MAIDSGFHAVTKADLREDLLQAEAERDRLREKLAAVVEAGKVVLPFVESMRGKEHHTTIALREALAKAKEKA